MDPGSRGLRPLGRGHELLFVFLPPKTYPRTRRHFAAEIRGPCCTESRDYVAADKVVRLIEGWCRSRKLNRGVMTRHGPRLAVATLPWPGTRNAGCETQGAGSRKHRFYHLPSRPRLVLRRFSKTYLPHPTPYLLLLSVSSGEPAKRVRPGVHAGRYPEIRLLQIAAHQAFSWQT